MASRLQEKQRRREERVELERREAERAQAGFPPRKPPGTRNALGEPDGSDPLAWLERNFNRFFVGSLIISGIMVLAISVIIVALILKLL